MAHRALNICQDTVKRLPFKKSELNVSTRPENLPEFRSPPLNEVVMGVQFMTPRGYQQIYAGEVWALYRDRFPIVEELSPIPPMFETFGLPQGQQISFGLISGALHNRFWFISEKRDHLIQFQTDRLLHNWRKSDVEGSDYPRFENIVQDFEDEINSLNTFMRNLSGENLSINQCELSYINHISADSHGALKPDDWFKIVNGAAFQADDIVATFRRAIRDDSGAPHGRLICDLNTAVDVGGQPLLVATLTARGAPKSGTIKDALEFIKAGRQSIVGLFADVTTDSAHKAWERTQ